MSGYFLLLALSFVLLALSFVPAKEQLRNRSGVNEARSHAIICMSCMELWRLLCHSDLTRSLRYAEDGLGFVSRVAALTLCWRWRPLLEVSFVVIAIAGEAYYLIGEGLLMPPNKDQAASD
jgi:hypothetical protein